MKAYTSRAASAAMGIALALSAAAIAGSAAHAEELQPTPPPRVETPPSSIEHPGDIGVRSHTNIEKLILSGPYPPHPPSPKPQATGDQHLPPDAGTPVDINRK